MSFTDNDHDGYDPDDFVDATPRVTSVPNKDIRKLRQAAKERDELKERLAAMERANAIRDAGIPNTGIGRLFIDAYKGEMEPGAIRAAAVEYGILDAAGGQGQGGGNGGGQGQVDAQAAARAAYLQNQTQATQVQSGAGTPNPDGQFQQALANAKNSKDVANAMAAHAAARGESLEDVIRAGTVPGW